MVPSSARFSSSKTKFRRDYIFFYDLFTKYVGLTYLKLGSHFWGSPVSYFGLGIAGIFFLIMHCRYGAKDVDIKNDGLAPMRELINIRRSGLTSPYLWLSRAGYLGFLIGMMH